MSSQNIFSIRARSDSMLVNELHLPTGIIYKNQRYLRNVKCWHKFIISNTAGLSRDEVLKAILDYVHPLDLIPVFYAKDDTNSNSYFMARNCEAAIQKLCKDNLVINYHYKKQSNSYYKPLKISLLLNFSTTDEVKIDVQKNVLSVLQNRFDKNTKTLNLDNLCSDSGLTEYCPLSQPKIMYFVLNISKNLGLEKLILSNNDLKLINPLDVLIGLKLRSIDLSNNKISSLDDISHLRHFQLKEIKLTGNPLCDCEEDKYISKIKEICPTVETLDGVLITLGNFPVLRKNYIWDDECFDIANQFLEYFFMGYDSKDRRCLYGLYDTNAMFSMTTSYLSNQYSSATANLNVYNKFSRNLMRAADLSKTAEFLYMGRDNIMELFAKLPFTQHDAFSFTTDVVFKNDYLVIIMITGIFREDTASLLPKYRLLGFSRTFALKIEQGSKYLISSEQYHVYNALSFQERSAFREVKDYNTESIQKALLPKPQETSDYIDLVKTMSLISKLKEEWSRKFLEENQYDLEKCLHFFVDLYKADRIPKEAYLKSV